MCSTHLTSMNVSGLLTTSVSWQTWWKRCGQLSDWWTRYAFRQTQRFNNTSSARNRVQRKLEERFCDCMEPNSAVPLNPKTSTWCSTTSGVRLHMSALRNRHFLSCSKKGGTTAVHQCVSCLFLKQSSFNQTLSFELPNVPEERGAAPGSAKQTVRNSRERCFPSEIPACENHSAACPDTFPPKQVKISTPKTAEGKRCRALLPP